MSKRGKLRVPSDAEEARTAAGIAADPDNPEWTGEDFRRAKPFCQDVPALAKSRRVRGPQKKPTKIAVSLTPDAGSGGAIQGRGTRLAETHGRGAEEGRRTVS